MRKLIILLILPFGLFGQIVFTENMGTPSGNTAISANTFQNSGTYTYSGTSDVRITTASSGYTGSSGSGNVFITNSVGKSFEISNINTTGMSDLILSLGHYKSTTSGNNELSIEVSSDGIIYTALSYSRTTGAGTATWLLINPTGTIPSASNLRIRFTNTSSSTQFRIDDVKLIQCKPTLNSSTKTGVSEQCVNPAGYTMYGDISGYYFAIKKNGNTINATVDIDVNGTTQQPYTNASSNGADQEHASFLMGRVWNVSCTGCTYGLGGGVDVRFYYHSDEPINAMNARDAAKILLPGSSLAVNNTGLEWFKTTNTVFVPTAMIGNKFPNPILKLTGTLGTQNSVNYVEFTGITSFSGGTGGYSFGPTNGIGNSLPVTWAGVNVKSTSNGNELNWETATEINTSQFIVEYSNDGTVFSAISPSIPAAGNSNELKSYTYLDSKSRGLAYYRIKQIDNEGTFDYSKIVMIKSKLKNENKFKASVFPTEIKNTSEINIEVLKSFEGNNKAIIYDVTGKVISHKLFSDSTSKLNIENLQSGIYFIKISSGEFFNTFKLIK